MSEKWHKVISRDLTGKDVVNINPTDGEVTDEISRNSNYNFLKQSLEMRFKPKSSKKKEANEDEKVDEPLLKRVTDAANSAYEKALKHMQDIKGKNWKGPNMSITASGGTVTVTLGPMELKDLQAFGDVFQKHCDENMKNSDPKNRANKQNTPQTPTQATPQTPTQTNLSNVIPRTPFRNLRERPTLKKK